MFYTKSNGGVITEHSDLLEVPHAFSTRYGGVSAACHLQSMNLGENRGDDPENVRKNYSILLGTIGRSPDELACGRQVHSTNIKYVTETDVPAIFDNTDGFITDRAGVVLAVKIADCVPILLADRSAGVVCALHAGWRGSVAGIAACGVEAMVKLGACRDNITAAIGASIHSCCYEVGDDFVEEFCEILGKERAMRYLTVVCGRYHADLQRLNMEFLCESGISPEHIDLSSACTCCHPDRYFSHRYTKGHRGTMAAVICL